MKKYDIMLSIAGSDSGGGAGIQADIKTSEAIGCFATTAITAVTVQNSVGVQSFVAIAPEVVAAQIDAVMGDFEVQAVKTGMLASSETIRSVAASLQKWNVKNLVVDPVMVSTSGHKLIDEQAIETLETDLLPLARIITPNIPEAEILCKQQISGFQQMEQAAKALGEKYQVSVLLKAGHLDGDLLMDVFYNYESDSILKLSSQRINTVNTHGTGCTLSSAIASYLSKGLDLNAAVIKGKAYLSKALEEGANYQIGHGHGPVKHRIDL